ncbi:MAG: hypothetical protein Q8P01_02865 [bacterium]|nr:hypothetical protein [bacterium]
MDKQYETFIEIARKLNQEFDEAPIVYGSFGLERIIKKGIKAADIDFLVKNELVQEKWSALKECIRGMGFILKREEEHEFERDGVIVAFAPETDVKWLTSGEPDKLIVANEDGARFRELTPQQYLELYEYLKEDSYRKQTGKAEKDKEKIRLIQEYLKEN